MDAFLLGGLIYVLLSLPAVLTVFLMHDYVLKKLRSLQIKRALFFFLLLMLLTPVMKEPGAALVSVPWPAYTVFYDLLTAQSLHITYYT